MMEAKAEANWGQSKGGSKGEGSGWSRIELEMVLQCFALGCLNRVGNSSTLPILNGWNWTCWNHHVKSSHDETITGLVQGKLVHQSRKLWLLLSGLRAIPKKSSMLRVLRFISTRRAGTSDMSYIYTYIYMYIYISIYIYLSIYRSYMSPYESYIS